MTCPVCNSLDHKLLFHDRNRRDNIDCSGSYVQCEDCSVVYLRERHAWEEIVRHYSSLDKDKTANAGRVDINDIRKLAEMPASRGKRLLRKVRFRPHSWPLESIPQGSKRLLDIGCGSGAKLIEFSNRGYDIWGIDVGNDTVRLCKELLPQGHFIRGELQEINLPDSHFDYIRIDNTLEHVPNPLEVIKECRRLLRKEGMLFIYVPNGRSLSMRFMKGNSISAWIPFHLQLFTRKSLRRLITEAGFSDMRIYEYTPNTWLPLSFVQWTNKHKPTLKADIPKWLGWICYPFGYLAAKLRMGEELIGTCVKDDKK